MKLTLEYKKARKEGLVASRPSMARAQPRSHEPLGRFRSPMRPIVGHAIGQRPDMARYKVAGDPDALLALTSAGTRWPVPQVLTTRTVATSGVGA